MSGNSIIQVVQSFVLTLVLVLLPWGIPFLIKDVGTVFLPLSALLSGGAFLFLVGRAVTNGDMEALLGALLVPCAMWLLFSTTVKWPGDKALAECHLGWTEVQKAQNQNPARIVLEDFYNHEAMYKNAGLSEALAILKGAEVFWSVEGSRSIRVVSSLEARDVAICRLSWEQRTKGEFANAWLSDEINFEQRTRKIDRCLVSRESRSSELTEPGTVTFRKTELGGGCQAISITERDSAGAEHVLGTVKYDFRAKKIYPELRRPGDDQDAAPLYAVTRAVFGDKVSVSALRRHFVN